jgi:hypothetical protein
LANAGVSASTPILSRFRKPVGIIPEKRWLEGLYLDIPEEWDDHTGFSAGNTVAVTGYLLLVTGYRCSLLID